MDPIHPISIESPVPLPIAAAPRITPTSRHGGRHQDESGRRRREPAPVPRRDPDADRAVDDGHPHIDVTV
jgi:hypothetical protein